MNSLISKDRKGNVIPIPIPIHCKLISIFPLSVAKDEKTKDNEMYAST